MKQSPQSNKPFRGFSHDHQQAPHAGRRQGRGCDLSPQETLTEDAPLVIDVTCSFNRTPWAGRALLFMDVRKEVKPDIVADVRYLPFRDGVVDEFYCDPPHMMRKGTSSTIALKRRLAGRLTPDPWTFYGSWLHRRDWLDFVAKSGLCAFAFRIEP